MRALRAVWRSRATIVAGLTAAVIIFLAATIRHEQIEGCHRGNTLRSEQLATNTTLLQMIGVVLPSDMPPRAVLPPRRQIFVAQFQNSRVRLSIANNRLQPAVCGSFWGLP